MNFTNSESGETSSSEVIADIGFNGDELKGVLRIGCSRSLVAATYPLKKKKIDPNDSKVYNDWACEIANQVLGRIKLECKNYGVKTTIGIPTIVSFDDEIALPFEPTHTSIFAFEGKDATMQITLIVALDKNVRFDKLIQDEFAMFVQNSEDSFFS